ncbi:hypothetical protein [Inconstantimicrobium mannanitabidum]|uniref:Uncharacterized protein n=1 Tax=Inconstantimicrobium mannanitabidum TaxID=1604901 RepID=A0ACB5RHQ2_9CLOT|nr:hypothetical protein [Clostridium sp. TW13]GKX68607.1 hypothetical protein rsdtw13_38650 [Clostridium sp. TW13]
MCKFGVQLLFVTCFELILTLLATEICQREIPVMVTAILLIEFGISLYVIYLGYKNENKY